VARHNSGSSKIEEKLEAIVRLLEDLFVLEAARAGLTRDNIRAVLPVDNNRISAIMRGLKRKRGAGADGSQAAGRIRD